MTNIVMIGRGRRALTVQAIESLYASTKREDFSLVFVHDCPPDEDFRVTKYLRSLTHSNFSLLDVGNSSHTLSRLKNIGVAWSEQRFGRGDFLHLGDSDVYFMPGWLDRMTAIAATSEIDAGFRLWGGQIHPFHQPIKQVAIDMTEHSILDGPSWFMRWDTWDLCGPLDRTTAPGACQSEEYGFCKRLTQGGIIKHWEEFGHEVTSCEGGRIGVIQPHVVIHTGLTQSNGNPAPGAVERRALIPQGVIAE